MAKFCSCGSLIINDRCTNKNCEFKGSAKETKAAKSSKEPKADKPKRTRKSSKCIVYNIDDIKNAKDQGIQE